MASRVETGAEGDKCGFRHAAFLPPHLSFPCELATTSAPYGKLRRGHLFLTGTAEMFLSSGLSNTACQSVAGQQILLSVGTSPPALLSPRLHPGVGPSPS